jgi:hypothetical protein
MSADASPQSRRPPPFVIHQVLTHARHGQDHRQHAASWAKVGLGWPATTSVANWVRVEDGRVQGGRVAGEEEGRTTGHVGWWEPPVGAGCMWKLGWICACV